MMPLVILATDMALAKEVCGLMRARKVKVRCLDAMHFSGENEPEAMVLMCAAADLKHAPVAALASFPGAYSVEVKDGVSAVDLAKVITMIAVTPDDVAREPASPARERRRKHADPPATPPDPGNVQAAE